MIYPNVRGSSGYGKSFLAADDIEKREDAIKDIGALLDHIHQNMGKELEPSRIAVMGGSYGGFMVFSSLVHFSSKLTCGLSNFGMTHLPSFLENTAAMRRAARRREYGDESDPKIRAFLEHVSPISGADRISAPTLITHGEDDTRVPLAEGADRLGGLREGGAR
ncbi:alpha beta-hydrolase [Coniophora puteana RWD-64-598 SS2]|uniref:Dipeptidyl-peptidase V n=1 Tax=Coniophora puteana (strain RWD-64-598) TaxID=741705 RepID=A0A5M3ML24_CONPW|nr:alpha beta-hydrolase [Coniophora puteana RWD-64-598 SS2]EIW79932.1 alpha beta-hydrolase [Coniophora puteana RWD-64-598 SS2]